MIENAEKLLSEKNYKEYYKLIEEIYKKNETNENASLLKKAEKMLNSYEEYKKYKSKRRKNHYETLEVTKDATIAEIKAGYKKLVLKFHPDRSLIDETKEIFLEIQTAYSVLSDEKSRAEYDFSLDNPMQSNTNVYFRRQVVINRDFFPFVFDDNANFYRQVYNFRARNQRRAQPPEDDRVKFFLTVIILILILIFGNVF